MASRDIVTVYAVVMVRLGWDINVFVYTSNWPVDVLSFIVHKPYLPVPIRRVHFMRTVYGTLFVNTLSQVIIVIGNVSQVRLFIRATKHKCNSSYWKNNHETKKTKRLSRSCLNDNETNNMLHIDW